MSPAGRLQVLGLLVGLIVAVESLQVDKVLQEASKQNDTEVAVAAALAAEALAAEVPQIRARGRMEKIRWLVGKRLLNFRDFKRMFHKSYRSPNEESLRQAVYFERLIQVSKSVIRYTIRLSDYYKSINPHSDMTAEERARLVASRPKRIMAKPIAKSKIVWDPIIVDNESKDDDDENDDDDEEEDEQPLVHRRHKRAASSWFSWMNPNSGKPTPENTNSPAKKPTAAKRPTTSSAAAAPKSHDLRSTKCLFPPGDQGACNSCASFVAVAQLEFLRCRETGELEKFSEQFLVDCGGAMGMMGCGGTDVASLNQFISQIGLESGVTYPYVGRQRRCPHYNRKTRRYNFDSAKTIRLKESGTLGAHHSKWTGFLEQKIPLHVGVYTNEEFEDYGGGVASTSLCQGSGGAHGMLLVGEGRENGADYWLLRNSYGQWGHDGYLKLNKKATDCFSDNGLGYLPEAFLKTFGSSFSEKNIPKQD